MPHTKDAPYIRVAELLGGAAERYEVEVLGQCENCGEVLTDEYNYWIDDGHKFCSLDCACEHNNIREVEV